LRATGSPVNDRVRAFLSAIRRLVDCLIAVVAINADASLLHADADSHLIAKADTSAARCTGPLKSTTINIQTV
jgi:predicted nucleic acid-binding protein